MYKPETPDIESDFDEIEDERWLEDAELASEIHADWEREEEEAA
jgi:hypothetical protein